MRPDWTTPDDVRVAVRRRWDDGSLLRAFATGEPFPIVDVALRSPRPAEIGDDVNAVRRWAAQLAAGSQAERRYHLVLTPVGGRHIGRNELPSRVIVSTYEQAWALLGVAGQVRELTGILAVTAAEPEVIGWVTFNPLRALKIHDDWPALMSAYTWLRHERDSGRYLREITAPGVDTKFVERHRPILAQLLGVAASSSGFVSALGLRAKPETVRLRCDRALGLTPGFSEATVRVDELAACTPDAAAAVIVENEITFLSVPVPADGVVLWGKGFEVSRPGSLPWLAGAEVSYWGDLDTHGFAILDRLRAWLPHTRSFLMDRATLLEHRDRWGHEGSPTSARLPRLDQDERALYEDLVTDRFGDHVRLEQERIDWNWATARFPYRPVAGMSGRP